MSNHEIYTQKEIIVRFLIEVDVVRTWKYSLLLYCVLTTDGIGRNAIIRLHPTQAVNGRSTNAPTMPPIDGNEPNQDISCSETGPDASGVSSDFNSGRIGVTHAINNPFENEIIAAANRN